MSYVSHFSQLNPDFNSLQKTGNIELLQKQPGENVVWDQGLQEHWNTQLDFFQRDDSGSCHVLCFLIPHECASLFCPWALLLQPASKIKPHLLIYTGKGSIFFSWENYMVSKFEKTKKLQLPIAYMMGHH